MDSAVFPFCLFFEEFPIEETKKREPLSLIHIFSPALQMPVWIVYLSGPLGFALALLRIIQKMILRFLPSHKKEAQL